MARVLITCPATNKPVPTGLTMDAEAFSMEVFDQYFALTGTASQATAGAPIKLGYVCQSARCRARFFLV